VFAAAWRAAFLFSDKMQIVIAKDYTAVVPEVA
jgi:hypothetical protein